MPTTYEIPLKVLWLWNCNEAEIALEFLLKPDGKTYQVKGTNKETFNDQGELKVCLSDNLEQVYYLSPNKKVFIADGSKLKSIWHYWKEGGGETAYNQMITIMQEIRERENISPISQMIQKDQEKQEVELTKGQINKLAFEIDFLIQMQKGFNGSITPHQVNDLIRICCEGFSENTLTNLNKELKARKVIE